MKFFHRLKLIYKKKLYILVCFGILFFVVGFLNNVDYTLVKSDQIYLNSLGLTDVNERVSFAHEIGQIKFVQRIVLDIAPVAVEVGIPLNQSRSLADLLRAGHGLCYDRSYVIESMLKYIGYKTRHVFIFWDDQDSYFGIFSHKSISHAVTEVLTSRGWIVVDSNYNWISLDDSGNPVSLEDLQRKIAFGSIFEFKEMSPSGIGTRKFFFIIGLHSRNGRMFAPYNDVPDIYMPDFVRYFWISARSYFLH